MKEGLDLYEFFETKKYSWWDLIIKATSSKTLDETIFYLYLADSPFVETPLSMPIKMLNEYTFRLCDRCPLWINGDGDDKDFYGVCILTGYETRYDGDCGNYKSKDLEEGYCEEEINPFNIQEIINLVSNK